MSALLIFAGIMMLVIGFRIKYFDAKMLGGQIVLAGIGTGILTMWALNVLS